MNLILVGPPASGKGVQAEKLVERFNLAHVEMGSILRSFEKEETPLGNRIREFVEKGALVPDELMFEILNDSLRRIEELGGIVFDGFPRAVFQAEYLEKFLADKGMRLDLVIFLELPRQESFKRLASRRICKSCGLSYNLLTKPPKKEGFCDSCGGELVVRSDEDPKEIEARLEEFEKHTKPLVEFYKEKGILEEVDGNRPIEVVFENILLRLGRRGLVKE